MPVILLCLVNFMPRKIEVPTTLCARKFQSFETEFKVVTYYAYLSIYYSLTVYLLYINPNNRIFIPFP